ncbi:MAG TPA: response regulator transcription factor [Candidatus Blautia excrementipullorum]|nr:response regulator transcription factor [Candidatus Blautia excrementipullorum]
MEIGFSAGADDYMVKPFSNVELMLRVRALLRRAARYTAPAGESTGRKDAVDESEALATADRRNADFGSPAVDGRSTDFGNPAADRRSADFGSPAAEGPKVSLENGNMEEVSLGAGFQSEHMLPYKDLVLDLDSQSVWKGEEMISLTRTEFQILELFFSHPKKIYSMENIYQSIWQEEAVGDSTIMVHIKNLRKKLGDSSRNPQYIKTAWGKGYYAE